MNTRKIPIRLYVSNVPEHLMRYVWLEAEVPIRDILMDTPLAGFTTEQDHRNEFEFYLRKHI